MVTKRWEILAGPSLKALEVSLTHEDTINGPNWHPVSFRIGYPSELRGCADSVHVFISGMSRPELHRFNRWILNGYVTVEVSNCLINALRIKKEDMSPAASLWRGAPQFAFKADYDSDNRMGLMELTI